MNPAFLALTREALKSALQMMSLRVLLFLTAIGTVGAALISEWTIEEPRRIFFNASALLLELGGGCLAILLGVLFSVDDRSRGLRLTSFVLPLSRGQWVTSRLWALTTTLLLYGVFCLAFLQGTMVLFGLGALENPQRVMLLFLFIFWVLMGHVSFLLGELLRKEAVILLMLVLWITGELSGPVFRNFAGNESLSVLQKYVHQIWQIDGLFLVGSITSPLSSGLPPLEDLLLRCCHALGICLFCFGAAALAIRRNRLPRL